MITKRDTLVNILGAVLPGLANKDKLPQAQSFIFTDGQVITYNDRLAIHHPLPADLAELQGAVRATELYKVLSKMPIGIDIDLTMTDAEVLIKTSTIQAKVRCEKEIVNQYSTVPIPEKFKKIPEGLLQAMQDASFSASTDLSKPLLVHLFVNGGKVTSCDNRRVTICQFKGKADKMFVPASVVSDLCSYEPVEYGVTEGWIHWKNKNEVVFSFRTLEGEYPGVEHFFEGVDQWASIPFPKGMAEAVGRVSEALDKNDLLPYVTVAYKGGKVVVSGQGPFATIKERLAVDTDAEVSFLIAAEFFTDLLERGVNAYIGDKRMCLMNDDKTFRHLVCLPLPNNTEV